MPEIIHSKAENVRPGQRHVFIAVPIVGQADGALTSFAWGIANDLRSRDIAADLFILSGHCHVDDSRNYLAWEFLNTDCTDFLFIDADVMGGGNAVWLLLEKDRDFVCGLYPYKGDELKFPVRMLSYGTPPVYEADGCIEVEAAPTGFMMMKRHVLEKIEATVPGYWNKEITKEAFNRPIPLMFERSIEFTGEMFNGRPMGDRWGGDYSFCKKWRALGGKVYVEPTIPLRHYGVKAFAGIFAPHLAHARGVQTPAFDDAIAALRTGAPMGAHFARMMLDWGNEYSARSDLLASAYWMAREAEGPILETGSGVSTLILGIAAELAGVKVHTLEHDPDYYRATIKALNQYGITSVRLHYAPLKVQRYDFERRSCLWYTVPDELPEDFAMVLCDGPQQRFGRQGMFKLIGGLVEHAKILMDDAETDVPAITHLRDWSERHGRQVHIITSGARPFAVSLPPQQQPGRSFKADTVSTAA